MNFIVKSTLLDGAECFGKYKKELALFKPHVVSQWVLTNPTTKNLKTTLYIRLNSFDEMLELKRRVGHSLILGDDKTLEIYDEWRE